MMKTNSATKQFRDNLHPFQFTTRDLPSTLTKTGCWLFMALVCFLTLPTASIKAAESSSLSFVTDHAQLLSPGELARITTKLKAHNSSGPGKLFLAIVKNLPANTTIEQLGKLKINEQLPLPNEKNDRIMLIVAIKDRKLRVETSKDVWDILTDDYCKTVISEKITPRFKEQRFAEGIEAGFDSIIEQLTKVKKLP
jgi:uncharacterized protein